MLAKAAVFILGILINYLESHKVNLSDRLHQIASAIGRAAPHLSQVASEAEGAILAVAPAVAAAFPGHGAANVANELAAAASVAQQVQGAIVGVVTQAPAPVPQSPVVDTASTPPTVDEAVETATAAAGVSAAAAATPSALETRIQLVESALFEMLPALAGVLKAFGK
jgi:folate-dependent phosphoribosylglycinamide formyltransferase PurN